MATIQIPNLGAVVGIDGTELIEVVQGGTSKRATTGQIAGLTIGITSSGETGEILIGNTGNAPSWSSNPTISGSLFINNWYNTSTLTAAQITAPFLLGTPTGTASYTLPLASAVETALLTPATGTGWEFTVFTTAAFAITIVTNTGWTLVGSMATGATANSFARFRAAKTGAAAYSLYRIS